MWRSSCFDSELFNENLMHAEEWECYSRILMQDIKGLSLDKVLFFGRKHSASNTGEYFNKNPKRVQSKVLAAKLIINELAKKGRFDNAMATYFLGLSKHLNQPLLIEEINKNEKISIRVKKYFNKRNKYFSLYLMAYKIKKNIKR